MATAQPAPGGQWLPRAAVRDLCKYYDAVQALGGISFEVRAGEVFGLLGPNGAGKSTALECLAGLIAPDSGAIEVFGLDLGNSACAARRQLGVALQATGLQEDITPREALESAALLYAVPADAARLLSRFGLAAKADARLRTLSPGERQRVALALALVNDPALLLLDEPTVGLDAAMRREFHQHIRALRSEGRAILLTTHDMDEAAQLCDRIAVLVAGRIVATGTPATLVASLQSAMRVQLVADRDFDPAWLTPPALFSELQVRGTELSFVATDTGASLARLLTIVGEHGLQILRLEAGRGTLADALLAIITARTP